LGLLCHHAERLCLNNQPTGLSEPDHYDSRVGPPRAATRTEHHEFWSCAVSVLDEEAVDRSRLHSPRQVTDAYLLALATAYGGRFVTFDRRISTEAVRGVAEENLVVL